MRSIKTSMNLTKFQRKYGDKGGVITFVDKLNAGHTLEEIGDHFGVSKQAIGQWATALHMDISNAEKVRRTRRRKTLEAFAMKHPRNYFEDVIGQYESRRVLAQVIKNIYGVR